MKHLRPIPVVWAVLCCAVNYARGRRLQCVAKTTGLCVLHAALFMCSKEVFVGHPRSARNDEALQHFLFAHCNL